MYAIATLGKYHPHACIFIFSQDLSGFRDISRSSTVRLLVTVINYRVTRGSSAKGQAVLIVRQEIIYRLI